MWGDFQRHGKWLGFHSNIPMLRQQFWLFLTGKENMDIYKCVHLKLLFFCLPAEAKLFCSCWGYEHLKISKRNRRENCQWQKAVTPLVLGCILCSGDCSGEGKDPLCLAMNCILCHILSRKSCWWWPSLFFADESQFWAAHKPDRAVVPVRWMNKTQSFCLGDQSHTVNNRQHQSGVWLHDL